jgi:hypothetical protein
VGQQGCTHALLQLWRAAAPPTRPAAPARRGPGGRAAGQQRLAKGGFASAFSRPSARTVERALNLQTSAASGFRRGCAAANAMLQGADAASEAAEIKRGQLRKCLTNHAN